MAIRPSISRIAFPPKVLGKAPDELRQKALQKFLRRISNLVCVNSLHPTTEMVQIALQRFLEVEERLESLAYLKLPTALAVRQMLQVFVHCVLSIGDIERVVSYFVNQYNESVAGMLNGQGRVDVGRTKAAVESLKDFIDHLQSVLTAGLLEDCYSILRRYDTSDSVLQYILIDRRSSDRGDGNPTEVRVNGGGMRDGVEVVEMEARVRDRKRRAEEMRRLVRSALRRQIEILVYVPCCSALRALVSRTYQVEERDLQRQLSRLSQQPQTYFGIPVHLQSVSNWQEVVCSMRMMAQKTLPQDKHEVLSTVAEEMYKVYLQEHPGEDKALGADEFLPIFIFVLVRARLPSVVCLKEELSALCDPELRMSEMGYYAATLEASLQHILEMSDGFQLRSIRAGNEGGPTSGRAAEGVERVVSV